MPKSDIGVHIIKPHSEVVTAFVYGTRVWRLRGWRTVQRGSPATPSRRSVCVDHLFVFLVAFTYFAGQTPLDPSIPSGKVADRTEGA
jgi:hypothetical protein